MTTPHDISPALAQADRPVPVLRWAKILALVSIAAATLIAIGVSRGTDQSATVRAIFAVSLTTLAAQIIGLLPINALRRLGGNWTSLAWIAAMPLRFVLALSAAIVLVKFAKAPAITTVLSMVGIYLAMLVSETVMMMRFLHPSPSQEFDERSNDRRGRNP